MQKAREYAAAARAEEGMLVGISWRRAPAIAQKLPELPAGARCWVSTRHGRALPVGRGASLPA